MGQSKIRLVLLGGTFRKSSSTYFFRHQGHSLLRAFRAPLRRRAAQSLALIDLVRSAPSLDEATVGVWVEKEVTGRVVRAVHSVIDRYLGDSPTRREPHETLMDRAERELIVELEEAKSIGTVGRFDGRNTLDREAHRRNFNRRHNPFLLLVGQVGEEGIDLQGTMQVRQGHQGAPPQDLSTERQSGRRSNLILALQLKSPWSYRSPLGDWQLKCGR